MSDQSQIVRWGPAGDRPGTAQERQKSPRQHPVITGQKTSQNLRGDRGDRIRKKNLVRETIVWGAITYYLLVSLFGSGPHGPTSSQEQQ